tara:strand:- start:663 stop:1358 length:696 start_codon:yes stop_codon:yes gene_type:complete
MSNDMKLIMESWRSNLLQESEGTKVADDILKDLEKEQQLDEALFSVGALLIGFVIKMATLSAMLSAIAKFGSFVQKKISGNPSSLLDNVSLYTKQASTHLATLGIPAGFAKLMQSRMVRSYLGDDKATKWSNWFRQVEKVLAFLVLLTAAGLEIFNGIQEAGGGIEMIKDLAQKSGIKDGKSLNALADLFDRLVDTGEIVATGVEASNQQGRQAIWSSIVQNLRDLMPQTP